MKSKKELRFFIQADRMMNLGYFTPTLARRIRTLIWPNKVMKFLFLMRKCQYYGDSPGWVNNLIYIYILQVFI